MQIWVQQLKFFWPCESFYEKWVTCLTKEHTTLYKKNYLINPEKNNHKKKNNNDYTFYIYIFFSLSWKLLPLKKSKNYLIWSKRFRRRNPRP
jgi:hypothetical protein